MREIRFKVWDKDTKEMSMGMDLYMLAGFLTGRYPFPEDHVRYEFLEFTGLKDKNGQEIYDGDIIVREDKNGVWEVRWNENCAGFLTEWDDAWKWIKANYQPIYEVIGNIYENPELLKK